MVGTPSVATRTLPPYRLSLVRIGDGADESWVADVDGLPNCSSRGATPEEAVRRAWASVQRQVDSVPGDADVPARHSGKLLVRMPATLHDDLARAAEAEGVSLNQLITGVLAAAVDWRSVEGASHAGSQRDRRRSDRIILAANFAVVALAAVIAIGILVMAWLG